MKPTALLALSVAGLLGMSACSSSSKTASPVPNVTLPGGDISEGASGVPAACLAFGQALLGASLDDATGGDALPKAIATLSASAPDELKNDWPIMEQAFKTLGELSKKYAGDTSKFISDPDAIKLFSNPDYVAASQRVSTYIDTVCK